MAESSGVVVLTFIVEVAVRTGWGSQDTVTNTAQDPYHVSPATDRTVTPNEPATAYYNEGGAYTVVNNSSGKVVQVSDYNDPAGWVPDSSIVNPFLFPGEVGPVDLMIY